MYSIQKNISSIFLVPFLAINVLASCGSSELDVLPMPIQLEEYMQAGPIMAHLENLNAIADAHGGNRASGTAGYRASLEYVKEMLADVELVLAETEFPFRLWYETGEPVLEQMSPEHIVYRLSEDFLTSPYSGNGNVTAEIAFVHPVIPPGPEPNTSSDGCSLDDFDDVDVRGKIAVLQRGSCYFWVKAGNAEAKGAVGVVFFNEGQEGRTEAVAGTLGSESDIRIPVLGTSFAIGKELYDAFADTPPSLHMEVQAHEEMTTTTNLVAETPVGNSEQVVFLGAHLDSVPEGPGINDNGSGSAALLELAVQMNRLKYQPINKIRMAWWAAEEAGLVGSAYYAGNLSPADARKIALYINFDTIGSPNYVRGVYESDTTPGSAEIRQTLIDYFTARGLPTEDVDISGASDDASFGDLGIPTGGVFTGAFDLKTEDQARTFGGIADEPFDPCCHQPCDTVGNLNEEILIQNAKAAAHIAQTYGERLTPSIFGDPSPRPSSQVASEPGKRRSLLPYDRFHTDRHLDERK